MPATSSELGLEECWQRGALLVEWPERAAWLWPAERLTVTLAPAPAGGADARLATLAGSGRWVKLLAALAGPEQSR